MPKLAHLAQDLRNAYDSHDRVAFEQALQRLQRLETTIPEQGCTRGQACVCNKHAHAVCMYRRTP
jgi:hypothetical protein